MKLQTATRLGLYAVLELARDPERTFRPPTSPSASASRAITSPRCWARCPRPAWCSGGRGATGGYRFTGNRSRTTLMDIVALFEPAPGQRAKEPGEDTDIGGALQRVLTEIDEIAEATLRRSASRRC